MHRLLLAAVLAIPAIAVFAQASAGRSEDWILYEQGNAMVAQHEYGKALQLYKEAIAAAGIFPEAEVGIGDIFFEEGERLKIGSGSPVSIRLPLTRTAAGTAVQLVRNGVDVIHLTANYHGRGWEKEDTKHVKDLIREVHSKLVSESCRDQVTLIASGGITRAEHVPKAIICGADLVAIDTTVLVALQCRFEGECVSPASGRITQEIFDSRWGEQRLVNLLGSWHDQLIEILSAMGIRDVRRLRGDVGRAMFNDDLEKEAFGDIARQN